MRKKMPPAELKSEAAVPPRSEPARQPLRGATPSSEAAPQPAVVGIGASAGGLAALKTLFLTVPEDTGLAFVVVMHLSPEYKSHLADLLRASTRMPVQQVVNEVRLAANHVYIIPPGRNLSAIDSHLRLSPMEKQRIKRTPIDHFFRTLAESHDGNSVGIILTGTGTDGTLGIQEIKGRGGLTVVQDPGEAEYDGMPRGAVATGVIDLVLPLADMIGQILGFLRTQPRVPLNGPEDEEVADQRPLLNNILALVRMRAGRDFAGYKQSTIMRRIRRRMQLAHIEELQDYLKQLQSHPEEVIALADDFLITVTSFFRDKEVFDEIEKQIIPELFRDRKAGGGVRVWSVGCATGEEAYSLAMLLLEEADRHPAPPSIQVFASDLHEHSLKRARDGLYPGDIENDVSEERLARFFHKDNDTYRIRKEVRDHVVFAPHNLLVDPPFSKIDLIVCRNVLIYLQRTLQPDILELFHYALRPQGWLVLGTAESVDSADLFLTENKSHGVYRKRNLPSPELRLSRFPFSRTRGDLLAAEQSASTGAEFVSFGAVHHRMVERYAPPSVLVSADNKVIHFSDRAGRYMLQPGGTPTTNVHKLVREELQIELRMALESARERGEPFCSHFVPLLIDGAPREVSVQARPSPNDEGEIFILIIFDEREHAKTNAPSVQPAPASRTASKELETELELTKRRLNVAIEEYEAGQEEMRASNEELQSANEELRSTMEELETSKEELQSINEELQTANEENRHKVSELGQLSDDLQQLMAATHIATLFLDRELRILRFTPLVGELFRLRSVDRGRPLSDLTHRLNYDGLISDAYSVLENLIPLEREVQDESNKWYLARIRPYRTAVDRIEGAVLTFVDITARKRSEEALRESEDRYRTLFESMDEGFCVAEEITGDGTVRDFRVLETNKAFVAQSGLTNIVGRTLREAAPSHLDFWVDVCNRLNNRSRLARFECRPKAFQRWLEVYAFRLPGAGPHVAVLLKDITEQKRAENALRDAARRDAFRIELADAVRALTDPLAIQSTSCRLLSAHLKVDSITYELLGQQGATHESSTGEAARLRPWDQNPELLERLTAGRSLVSSDVLTLSELTDSQRTICRATGLHAHVSVPLLKDRQLVAVFGVYHSGPRSWTEAEISLIEEVAERTWASAERARAEQAVRQREASLREADRCKDEFLAVLSHELRNPLTPILNSLHILDNVTPGSDQANAAQVIMKRQVALLARLVDDLLDLTRVARGKVQLLGNRVALHELLGRVVEDHRSLFEKVQVTLELQGELIPVWVHGDASRLVQAIGNLLQNSAKFTSPGGLTTVSLTTDAERERAVIRIADSGVGMNKQVLSQLFEPFMQGEATLARSKGGLGLGLALTRRLIELHGGQIDASSAGKGHGSEFVIHLPLQENKLEQPETPPEADARSPSRRVLIIEDNADAADTLRQVLQLCDHEVSVAYDGINGLTAARTFHPDIVLCDIGLPGMDGYEVARAFKSERILQRVFLVALSGYAMPEDRQRAAAAGFDHHLAKPPKIDELQRLFKSLGPPLDDS